MDVGADSCDDTTSFVTQDHGCLQGKVTIATMEIIMQVAATETSSDDGYLSLMLAWGPEGTFLIS
jgi:hypothetical protein